MSWNNDESKSIHTQCLHTRFLRALFFNTASADIDVFDQTPAAGKMILQPMVTGTMATMPAALLGMMELLRLLVALTLLVET